MQFVCVSRHSIRLGVKWVSRIADAFFPTLVLLFFDDQHRKELVGSNVVKRKGDAEPEGSAKVERAAEELPGLRGLRSIEAVERAMITAASVIRRIGTELRIAQLFTPQRPIN